MTPEVWTCRPNRLAFCRQGVSSPEADVSPWLPVILKLTRNLSCDLSGPWTHIHATALSFRNGPDLSSFCFRQKNTCSTILDNHKQEKKLLKHNSLSFSHLCNKHNPNCIWSAITSINRTTFTPQNIGPREAAQTQRWAAPNSWWRPSLSHDST